MCAPRWTHNNMLVPFDRLFDAACRIPIATSSSPQSSSSSSANAHTSTSQNGKHTHLQSESESRPHVEVRKFSFSIQLENYLSLLFCSLLFGAIQKTNKKKTNNNNNKKTEVPKTRLLMCIIIVVNIYKAPLNRKIAGLRQWYARARVGPTGGADIRAAARHRRR